MNDSLDSLCEGALDLDKWSLGRLISIFETRTARERRARAIERLEGASNHRAAGFVGVTGAPGSGKSTLIGELATRIVAAEPEVAVAVVAVDPSSHVSGGALLGDRTRVRFPPDQRRLFFRSQASSGELGGVGPTTYQVCRVLRYVFDLVFVETVGIGQSEVEIEHLVDHTLLLLQPGAGDQIQYLKSGVMEIPDAFVLNKCDQREAAEASYHALLGSLRMTRPSGQIPPVFRVSAVSGEGLDALVGHVLEQPRPGDRTAKDAYFFRKWAVEEFGRRVLPLLDRYGPGRGISFEGAQNALSEAIRQGA